jgi:hypothetical protein
MKWNRFRLARSALLVALVMAAAACGSGGSGDGGGDTAAPAGESATGPVLDASILSGAATTLDGGSFDLGTLADKDLVVWFWAPW